MQKTILFLDADQRYTLSVVRSVGQLANYKIITAGTTTLDMSRYSKYSQAFYLYPDPIKNIDHFLDAISHILEKANPDFIFPCSDISILPIYTSGFFDKYRTKLILPDKDCYFKTFDKRIMNNIAKSCNIRIAEEIDELKLNEATFPFVLKPRCSWYCTEHNTMERGFRSFINDLDCLNKTVEQVNRFDPDPLLQHIVPGRGYGIFIAAKEGEIFASFAHERIREVPPDGGVSTLRKSVQVNANLLKASEKLIKKLNWTGIGMVEFKGEREEDACFMEINGRPWGSIDLAVCSGVDFPKIMIDLFVNNLTLDQLSEKHSKGYTLGNYSCWIMGEANYIRHIIKSKSPFSKKLREALQIFKRRPEKTTYDTFRLNDPLPFVAEFLSIVRNLFHAIYQSMIAVKKRESQ